MGLKAFHNSLKQTKHAWILSPISMGESAIENYVLFIKVEFFTLREEVKKKVNVQEKDMATFRE